jgi:hemerythrin superfamily protein
MVIADPDATDGRTANAVNLLRQDHRLVQQLFEDFQRAEVQQLDPLARRICKMLKIHTQIEEELFYPAARQALADTTPVVEAEAEHATAKRLIAEAEALGSDDRGFREAVKALAEHTQHHVQDEEGQLFPRLKATQLDLYSIGVALAERRYMLMDVLGLHEDDELAATPRDELSEHAGRQPTPDQGDEEATRNG